MTTMGMRAIKESDVSRVAGNISLHRTAFRMKGWKYCLTQDLSRNGLEWVLFPWIYHV
jgi:hypothetical protein